MKQRWRRANSTAKKEVDLKSPGILELDIRPCPSFPGYYADKHGDVWSARRCGKQFKGPQRLLNPLRKLKPILLPNGRYALGVRLANGNTRQRKVHTVVADAFLGTIPAGLQVRHLNCIKTDNRPINLSYGTCQENHQDSRDVNDYYPLSGSRNYLSRLTPEQVFSLRIDRLSGMILKDLAKKYQISISVASDIARIKSYRHEPRPDL